MPTTEDIRIDRYRRIDAAVQTPIDPAVTADIACFMTTDSVDADWEVMDPAGADLSRFEKNPILLLCHGYGQPGSHYALPIGKVLGTKKRPNGILAQVKFAESTEMGREVKGLFQEGMFRSFSIGFRSVESSRMTREEAFSRPDWREAYEKSSGKITVHRKWQLLELSAVPLPSNADALVTTFKSRGVMVPLWLQEEMKMNDATDATKDDVLGGDEKVMETKVAKPESDGECDCGKPDCPKCSVQTKDADEELAEGEDEDDTDDNGEAAEGAGFRRGDHVKVKAPHYKGFGEVQGVYRKGHVPHVAQDVMGSKDDPASRVRCYKAMGDGHVPTADHVGVKCSHMTKMSERMQMPSKKFAPPPEKKAVKGPEPLPPLVALSDEDLQQQAIETLSKLPELVANAVDRRLGVV